MAMAMSPGPMAQRLSRFRMPMQGGYPRPQERMPAMNPEMMDEDMVRSGPYDQGDAGIEMPPGQGDMGTEIMAGEQQREEPMPIGQPGAMGPVGARITQVHSPAEAKAQRGYAMPGVDVPGNPSMKSPLHGSGQGADITDTHTGQHQTIAKALNQRKWMAQQKLVQEHARLSAIVRGAKAGQNVDAAQQQLSAIEGMLKTLGTMGGGQPGE